MSDLDVKNFALEYANDTVCVGEVSKLANAYLALLTRLERAERARDEARKANLTWDALDQINRERDAAVAARDEAITARDYWQDQYATVTAERDEMQTVIDNLHRGSDSLRADVMQLSDEKDATVAELATWRQAAGDRLRAADQLGLTVSNLTCQLAEARAQAWTGALERDVAVRELIDANTCDLTRQLAEYRAERDEADAWCSRLMDERDICVKQIEDVADALGDESEWTNLNDRGDAAYEAACAVVAQRDAAVAERDDLKRRLDGAGRAAAAEYELLISTQRQLVECRKLLATPTDPPGMEQPEVVAIKDGTYEVAWCLDLEGCGDMKPDEAIGYGAALIRAALAARARAGRGV